MDENKLIIYFSSKAKMNRIMEALLWFELRCGLKYPNDSLSPLYI